MMKKAAVSAIAVIMLFTLQLCAFASYMTYSVRSDETVLVNACEVGGDVKIADSFRGRKITAIGANVFQNNNAIENISIPDSVTSIEWGAFENCSNLKSVTIPSGVKLIEDMTFSGCTSLGEVKLPEGLCAVGVRAFAFSALSDVVIPEGAMAIDTAAFEGCKELKTVSIPESVVYIGEKAFEGCDKLVVECAYGSAAQIYCAENGIAYALK